MKKAYLPLFLIFLCLFPILQTKAQNWQPIIKGYTYNYLLNNQQLPVYSIKVDSAIKNTTGDSVYYLNKVFSICANCKDGRINLENREYSY